MPLPEIQILAGATQDVASIYRPMVMALSASTFEEAPYDGRYTGGGSLAAERSGSGRASPTKVDGGRLSTTSTRSRCSLALSICRLSAHRGDRHFLTLPLNW
jgi:hypothetical protein